MLGWEFPPYFAGGVGVVCEALTRALAQKDVDITYVMPAWPEHTRAEHMRLLVASRFAPHIELIRLDSQLEAYAGFEPVWSEHISTSIDLVGGGAGRLYAGNLLEQMARFERQLVFLVEHLGLDFDVIHAHDWTTFGAALAVKRITGKPLVVHVHITEFDKTGGQHADPRVWQLEHDGMAGADLVVTVSRRVRQRCIERYLIDGGRIHVVYNGVDSAGAVPKPAAAHRRPRTVLFLGRITLQKGPDWFLRAARRVADVEPSVRFVMAGSGDMLPALIERAAEIGLGDKVGFAGFVDREQAIALYRSADVFVMPSVSEPFGIVPLEAMDQGVPTIVSRQSGVAEVLRHAIKVDFWNVDDLAGKILAALFYPTLSRELGAQGRGEVTQLSWEAAAGRVLGLYHQLARSQHVA